MSRLSSGGMHAVDVGRTAWGACAHGPWCRRRRALSRPCAYTADGEDYPYKWGGSRSDPFSRLSTRVRDFILYPCRSPHGGRLKNPRTWVCAHGSCAHTRLGPSMAAREARANGRDNGLGGPPQERLPLHGRRGPTRPSCLRLGRAAFDAVMPCRLWLLGWRDVDASLCSGLLAAMPRCLCLRLERNSAGRCHGCGPGCRRHRLSRGMW